MILFSKPICSAAAPPRLLFPLKALAEPQAGIKFLGKENNSQEMAKQGFLETD